MYEALAGTLEIQGRPAEEVERAVMSIADFGPVEYKTMLFSASYLSGIDRNKGALHLCQQASAMRPESPEPYVMSLKMLRKVGTAEDVGWAVEGTLQYAWSRDYREVHREAENVFLMRHEQLVKAGETEAAAKLKERVEAARTRDLIIRLTWVGEGDLDLVVEEPFGGVCSYETPDSNGGGVLTRDGFGPQVENCIEEYVCAKAMKGEYRILVNRSWGDITSNRATMTVIHHQGTPEESTETHIVQIDKGMNVVRVTLDHGRRKTPRTVATAGLLLMPHLLPPKRSSGKVDVAELQKLTAEFQADRQQASRIRVGRVGGFGFAPVLTIIPDGVTLDAMATISPDRRYVRIGINPTFRNVTSVSTFSIIGGVNQAAGLQPGVGQPAP